MPGAAPHIQQVLPLLEPQQIDQAIGQAYLRRRHRRIVATVPYPEVDVVPKKRSEEHTHLVVEASDRLTRRIRRDPLSIFHGDSNRAFIASLAVPIKPACTPRRLEPGLDARQTPWPGPQVVY